MSDCIVQLEMENKKQKEDHIIANEKSSDGNINKELIICCLMPLVK